MAAKVMRSQLEAMKDIDICENVVTVKGAVNDETRAQIEALAEELAR